jgi:hypothetical protein
MEGSPFDDASPFDAPDSMEIKGKSEYNVGTASRELPSAQGSFTASFSEPQGSAGQSFNASFQTHNEPSKSNNASFTTQQPSKASFQTHQQPSNATFNASFQTHEPSKASFQSHEQPSASFNASFQTAPEPGPTVPKYNASFQTHDPGQGGKMSSTMSRDSFDQLQDELLAAATRTDISASGNSSGMFQLSDSG